MMRRRGSVFDPPPTYTLDDAGVTSAGDSVDYRFGRQIDVPSPAQTGEDTELPLRPRPTGSGSEDESKSKSLNV